MKALLLTIFSMFFSYGAPAEVFNNFQSQDLIKGQEVTLKFPTEKTTVLVFLSSKCPCSASHEEILKKLSQEFSTVAFYGIHSNSNEDAEDAKRHFSDAQINFPIIKDTKNYLANKLGALKTPHAFVLSTQGDLLYQGGVTDSSKGPLSKINFLREALEDLRDNKPLRHKEGRALGCYIQRVDEE